MSDDQLFEDPDEIVVSKVQRAVQVAMKARKEMEEATNEAIDAATTFGYELGAIDREQDILEWIRENRTEVADGVYRDHFTSESLIAFIEKNSRDKA